MAKNTFVLALEMDIMNDAIRDLQHVHMSLAKCHGDAYRKLDRRIERFLDAPSDCLDIHYDSGLMLAIPKGELTEILRDAHQLGMIS